MNDYTIFSVNNNDAIVVLIIVSTAAVVAAVSLLLEIKFWPEMKTKEKRDSSNIRTTSNKQKQTFQKKQNKTKTNKLYELSQHKKCSNIKLIRLIEVTGRHA